MRVAPWPEVSGLEGGEVSKTNVPSTEASLLKRPRDASLLKSAPSCREPSGVGHSMESAVPLALVPRERESDEAAYAPPPCAERSPG